MKKKIGIFLVIFGILFGGVFLPASSVFAQNTNIESFENQDYENRVEGMCKILPPGTNITGCILEGYYYAILYPSFYFAYFTGSIFDYFLAYSISTGSYTGTNNQFVERGWSIIRDISNIAFIFSLLYVAIKHILQAATSKTKRFLKSIIIAALLINFSLFFTKIIIDAGNILARAFYSNIEVPLDDNPDHKSISQGVIQYVNPQKLMSSDMFTPTLSPGRPPEEVNNGWVFMIMLVATIINVIIALTFLSVFLLFAARVIGLWFMMIFSPLAFVSTAIPNGSSILGRFGFSRWLKETTSLSFMAPVFMFFLFLLVMFLDIAFTTVTPFNNQSSVQKFMAILVPFIAVVVILNAAKKSAKDMAGEFGEQITKWAGKVAGFAAAGALGVAGGAAIAARYTVGAGGTALARSATLRRGLTSNNRFIRGASRFTSTAARAAARSSFDPRNTWVGKKSTWLTQQAVQAATGQKMSTKVFGYDASKGAGEGGYRKLEKDKIKENVNEQRRRASEEDLKEEELVSLQSQKRAMEAAQKEAEKLEQEFNEISKQRPITPSERDRLEKAREDLREKTSTYENEKERVAFINRRRREERAKWQEMYFWKTGNRKAAESVIKGEKPESKDELADLFKEFRKWKQDKDKEEDS